MGEGVSFDVVDRTCLWQCHQTAANKQSHMGVLSCLIYFLDWMWEQLQLCRVSMPTLWTSKFYTSSQNAWRPHRDFILYLLFPGHPIGVQVKSKTSRHPTSVNNSFTKPQSLKIAVSGGVRGSVIRDSTLFSRLQYIYTIIYWYVTSITNLLRFEEFSRPHEPFHLGRYELLLKSTLRSTFW